MRLLISSIEALAAPKPARDKHSPVPVVLRIMLVEVALDIGRPAT